MPMDFGLEQGESNMGHMAQNGIKAQCGNEPGRAMGSTRAMEWSRQMGDAKANTMTMSNAQMGLDGGKLGRKVFPLRVCVALQFSIYRQGKGSI